MKSFARAAVGLAALAAFSAAPSLARNVTIDQGYTVDPCYKQCSPLLASVSPRQEARRVYANCFAYCSNKGSITCPGGVVISRHAICPR